MVVRQLEVEAGLRKIWVVTDRQTQKLLKLKRQFFHFIVVPQSGAKTNSSSFYTPLSNKRLQSGHIFSTSSAVFREAVLPNLSLNSYKDIPVWTVAIWNSVILYFSYCYATRTPGSDSTGPDSSRPNKMGTRSKRRVFCWTTERREPAAKRFRRAELYFRPGYSGRRECTDGPDRWRPEYLCTGTSRSPVCSFAPKPPKSRAVLSWVTLGRKTREIQAFLTVEFFYGHF